MALLGYTRPVPLLLAAHLLAWSATHASAQAAAAYHQPRPVLPRADASVGVGWFSGTFQAPEQGTWYNDAAWWGGHVGYYWTENIKLEVEVSAAGEGRGWSSEEGTLPSGRPYYRYTEHGLSTRSLSGSLVYQFGHNLFFHPFLGAGVDLDVVRSRVVNSGSYYADSPGPAPGPAPDATLEKTGVGAFGVIGF